MFTKLKVLQISYYIYILAIAVEEFVCKKMAARLELFTLEDIKAFTDNFNKKNMVGDVQFGKVYRGKIEGGMNIGAEARDVTVKIWNKSSDYIAFTYDEYMMVKASS